MQGQTNPSSPIQAGSVENSGPGEGLHLVTEPNPTPALGWQFLNQIGSGLLGFGANLASVYSPGFFPLVGIAGGWPEPGDPVYTSAADGPELQLITLQLSGLENYSVWSENSAEHLS